MARYIALIRKEDGTDYGVDFPDFPGCITAGSTLDEAIQMAEEALSLHAEVIVEDGDDLPDPSTLDEVMADEHNGDAMPTLIELRVSG